MRGSFFFFNIWGRVDQRIKVKAKIGTSQQKCLRVCWKKVGVSSPGTSQNIRVNY